MIDIFIRHVLNYHLNDLHLSDSDGDIPHKMYYIIFYKRNNQFSVNKLGDEGK